MKSNIHCISDSECKADPEKFRPVLMIDSDLYRVGKEDCATREEALTAAKRACGPGCFYNVYDDRGKSCLKER